MNSELNFDLPVLEIAVSIGADKYVLREASGDAACRYRNKITSCAKRVGEEMIVDGPIADAEPLLVSLCLFAVDAAGVVSVQHVSEQTVRAWPLRVVKTLFEKIQEISPLETEGDEDLNVLEREQIALAERIEQAQSVKNSASDTAGG